MNRSLVERRLAEVGDRLRALREELRMVDEQLLPWPTTLMTPFRALVSETRWPTVTGVTPSATPTPWPASAPTWSVIIVLL